MRAMIGNHAGGIRRGWLSALRRLGRRLAAARRGSVAITFGLSFIPLIIAVGVGIDLGRAYIVKEKLLHTTDAAGLAIGAAYDSGQDLATVRANYFAANFPSGGLGTVTGSNHTINGSVITVTATASVGMTFMKIAGINTLNVSASSQITRELNTLELVMVLDNTKSMTLFGSSKLTDLKSAANSLVDILFGNATTSTQVKIGLVPFAATVNIGTSNTAYISNSTGWTGCVQALASPDDAADSSTGPWNKFSPASSIIFGTGCPQAITPLTNVKATLTTAINAMSSTGYTHVNYGAVWGWRVISPSEPFIQGAAYGTADNTKAVIILTDGANTFESAYSAYQAYGTSPSVSDLNNKLTSVCNGMKAQGIIVYTIMFDLNDATVEALFQACATDVGKYYNSPTGAELTRAFRAIAAELKKLRITG